MKAFIDVEKRDGNAPTCLNVVSICDPEPLFCSFVELFLLMHFFEFHDDVPR